MVYCLIQKQRQPNGVYDSFAFLRDPCGFFVFPVVKMQTTKCSKVAQSTPLSYPP
jgi:hypothetical protein